MLLLSVQSGRQSYDAIGYVQLKREQNFCTVKCTVFPEHKVRSKYTATIKVDENEEVVTSVQCHDCPASEGGCKHGVAFLMWLHRRSEEPSCTSVEYYWKKSNLSKVGTSIKILSAKDMSKRKVKEFVPKTELLNDFVMECKKKKMNTCQFIKHEPDYSQRGTILSLHHLIMKYNDEHYHSFFKKISMECSNTNLKNAEIDTQAQHNSGLWYELRYGRITASKCFGVSRCKTNDGVLVSIIFGMRTSETSVMSRDRKLEAQVRKIIEKKLDKKIETCGLYISKTFPIIAASPDGKSGKITFEIKCPASEKTLKSFANEEGKITAKYFAQIQKQMYCAHANESYFCVASSDFETINNVIIIKVDYDQQYVTSLLDRVVSFWKENIFPVLYKSVATSQ
ncbi:hypothetical protein ACJJTC_009587 [Scirpophaga incertulas]